MNWRDQLQPASFRGIHFLYKTTDGEFGQNTVTHVFPLRDAPTVEFLGKKPRKRKLNCYLFADPVSGQSHIDLADAFIRAVEDPSPGKLVHPHFGEMQVSVTDFSGPVISTAEGGMASFTLEVIEGARSVFISSTLSTIADVGSKADAANAAIQASFGSKFSIINKAAFVADEAAKVVNAAADSIDTAVSAVTGLPDTVSGLMASVGNFTSEVSSLIQSPVILASGITGIFTQLSQAASGPVESLGILKSFFGWGAADGSDAAPFPVAGTVSSAAAVKLATVPGSTPNRKAQAANQQAMVDLMQQAATVEAVRQSSLLTFDSAQQAATVRQQLQDQLDALIETADDTAFHALVALRTAMQKDITARGADLPQLITYTPKSTIPAALVAWKLYGDPTRDLDIVARNGIPMPAFMTAGEPLEVLSE